MDPSPLHPQTDGARRIEEIAHGGIDYEQVSLARDRILRQPLGLSLASVDTRGEETQRHFVVRTAERIEGGVIAKISNSETARLRQMWVESERSGQGVGRELLNGVMSILGAEGIREVVLHAREPVIGFYRKCGFKAEGPTFEEVGIPHRRMTRMISPERQSPGDRQ